MKRFSIGVVWFLALWFGTPVLCGAVVGALAGSDAGSLGTGYQAGNTAGEAFVQRYGVWILVAALLVGAIVGWLPGNDGKMKRWAKRLGFRRPSNNIEWTAQIGFGFLLGAVICWLLFVTKPLEYPPRTLTALYISHLLRDIGFGIIASAILIDGLNRLRTDEKKTKGYVKTSFGILLFLFLIGNPALSSTLFAKMQAELFTGSNLLVEKLTQALAKRDLSAVDRANYRQQIAREKYLQDGSLAEYTEKNDLAVKYQPTPEDLYQREASLFMQQRIRILRIEMICWTIAFVAVLTISILNSNRKPLGH